MTLRPSFDPAIARAGSSISTSRSPRAPTNCPGASRRRSGWRSPWGCGRRSSFSTSRWPAWTRWLAASSCTCWSTRSAPTAPPPSFRRMSSPTSSRRATGCSSSVAGGAPRPLDRRRHRRAFRGRGPRPGGTVRAITGTSSACSPDPAGGRLSLVRGDGAGGRQATLEEVVLGHLAAARKPRPTIVSVEQAA